jgi:transposase
MKAIPVSTRQRIIELYKAGKSTVEIAGFSGFCVAAVRRVRQQFNERGTLEPQTRLCGRKTLLTTRRKKRLEKLLAKRPDSTLRELGQQMDRPFRTSTVDLWVRKLGLTYKKKRSTPPSRTGPTWRSKGLAGLSVSRRFVPAGWYSWTRAAPICK